MNVKKFFLLLIFFIIFSTFYKEKPTMYLDVQSSSDNYINLYCEDYNKIKELNEELYSKARYKNSNKIENIATEEDKATTTKISAPVSEAKNNDSGRIVYLTIDDGPSSIVTPKMLDILKSTDTKATFFIIGNQISGNEAIIKRIANDGHSIGVHSYTHDIKKIYQSNEILINEMNQTQELLYNITGIKTNILRFPGGSYPNLSISLLDDLHRNNYKIYDWTISAGDGTYPDNTPSQLYANATESIRLSKRTILLMHCKPNNATSVTALPEIIKFYKDSGYKFKVMDQNTEEYYFNIKNK